MTGVVDEVFVEVAPHEWDLFYEMCDQEPRDWAMITLRRQFARVFAEVMPNDAYPNLL